MDLDQKVFVAWYMWRDDPEILGVYRNVEKAEEGLMKICQDTMYDIMVRSLRKEFPDMSKDAIDAKVEAKIKSMSYADLDDEMSDRGIWISGIEVCKLI